MVFSKKKTTALDVNIEGSLGKFYVSHPREQTSSVKVDYMLTHINLTELGGHNEKLIAKLAPVREVFELQQLDFEQIMQRDIDDGRVSKDLIPYILGASETGLIKLFPPIIVVVLPSEKKMPLDLYPEVKQVEEEIDGYKFSVTRSGTIGKEVFEIRRYLDNGELQDFNGAEVRINTSRSSLVIVDGQHRAMALIALYRNLVGWPEGTKAYEYFYERWTKKNIESYDLSEVKLPVMFCIFPELNEGNIDSPMKVHEACRSIFLALNKNAKKVTEARNFLLDDQDIISSFMRAVLTRIKENDKESNQSIRIWNIELDAPEERVKLNSDVAISGVTHLYNMIERLMLGDAPGVLLRQKSTKLKKRTDLSFCMSRLRVKDELLSEQYNAKRKTFPDDVEEVLTKAFDNLYGCYIVRILSEFEPYNVNNLAAIDLYHELKNSAADAASSVFSMLFDGQGMKRVFDDYLEKTDSDIKEKKQHGDNIPPELEASHKSLQHRQNELSKFVSEFKLARLSKYLQNVPSKMRESKIVKDAVERVFENTFTTAAFQTALVITFFSIIEEINDQRDSSSPEQPALTKLETDVLFEEYISSVNSFFYPKDENSLKKIMKLMYGSLEKLPEGAETKEETFKLEYSSDALRNILIPGELNPKEWTSFRVVLLEIWESRNAEAQGLIQSIRVGHRRQLFPRFVERREKQYKESLSVEELPDEKKQEIKDSCSNALARGLKVLNGELLDDIRQTFEANMEKEVEQS